MVKMKPLCLDHTTRNRLNFRLTPKLGEKRM